MTYTIIGHPNSRAIRILWLLEELDLDWTLTVASPRSEPAFKYNPGGKIPILLDGDDAVIDSVAAITYLADKHGRFTHPAGTIARAQQDSLTQFACDEIDGSLWTAAKHRFALPEEYRVAGVKETAEFEWSRACDTLAVRLGTNDFLSGNTLTIPDIVVGHCAGWAKSAKFAWPDSPLGTYFERMQSRPALARAREKAKAIIGT